MTKRDRSKEKRRHFSVQKYGLTEAPPDNGGRSFSITVSDHSFFVRLPSKAIINNQRTPKLRRQRSSFNNFDRVIRYSSLQKSCNNHTMKMIARIANLALLCLWGVVTTEAFVVLPQTPLMATLLTTTKSGMGTTSSSSLFSTPPRKPRRNLQKRRKRQKDVSAFVDPRAKEDDFPWDTAESRPLITANAIEAGEDYWIDEEELKKQEERRKPPKRLEGQVTDEKLWGEVLSPYRQNWIGLFSVMIAVLVVIVTQFPELLQTPVITIPDL